MQKIENNFDPKFVALPFGSNMNKSKAAAMQFTVPKNRQ